MAKEDDIESSRGGDEDNHSENEADDMFTFNRRYCTKMTGPGTTFHIAEETRSCDKSTMGLTVWDWGLIDGDDEDEPIWLGRVVLNPDWAVKEFGRMKQVEQRSVIMER